jgi:hypothetical protein
MEVPQCLPVASASRQIPSMALLSLTRLATLRQGRIVLCGRVSFLGRSGPGQLNLAWQYAVAVSVLADCMAVSGPGVGAVTARPGV